MTRQNIEVYMKENNLTQLDIYMTKDSSNSIYCSLKSGFLTDYQNHRLDRNADIYGFAQYDGKGNVYKISFDDTSNRIQVFSKGSRI